MKILHIKLFFILLFFSACSQYQINTFKNFRFLASNPLNESCIESARALHNDENTKSFIYSHILKTDHLNNDPRIPHDDLNASRKQELKSRITQSKIYTDTPLRERYEIIKNYPIEDIVAAPGHRYLRNPAQVMGLVDYFKGTPRPDFSHDKILLNVIIDSDNKVKSIDLWNAHHRLVAFLEAGYKSISELSPDNIEILVNGVTTKGENWKHYLPSAGVNWKKLKKFSTVPPDSIVREGTIAVSGKLSNFKLGARNTLRQLHTNTLSSKLKKMRIGVYFGTFDPLHEGHIRVIKYAMKEKGLDEVIIVPNINPVHKKPTNIKHRNAMIALRIKDTSKINLFTGDSSVIIDKYGRNPFFERIIQLYGTTDLHQIVGEDSFIKLNQSGQIDSSNFRKYIVLPREGDDTSAIGKTNPEKVTILKSFKDSKGLSSTKIRKRIKKGKKIDPSELNTEVLQYIIENNIYR